MPALTSHDVMLMNVAYLKANGRARELKLRLDGREIADRIKLAISNGERELDKLEEFALLPRNMVPLIAEAKRTDDLL